MGTPELHLDGNALAGLLEELFGADMTTAERVCGSCGMRHEVGAHRLYRGAGVVLRCPSCGDLALCVATLPGRHVVRLTGSWTLVR